MIYPPVCGICGKLNKNSLCKRCEKLLQKQIMFEVEDYKNTSSYFDEHIYIFQYSNEIRNALLNYKFNEKSYIHEAFVNFLKNNKKKFVQIKKYDIIVPVPISRKRLKTRGYNQSAVFARKLADICGIAYKEDILVKIKDNKPQSELKRKERNTNVQNVYIAKNKKKIYNKKILIVDDIFTTGSTANECAKVLNQSGANKVGVFTIAKD